MPLSMLLSLPSEASTLTSTVAAAPFSLVGCSICKRVNEMEPQQQALFFTLVAGVLVVLALAYWLVSSLAAVRVPGLSYSQSHCWPLGDFRRVAANSHCMNTFKKELVREIISDHQQTRIHALMQAGADAAAVTAVGAPEMIGWSIPASPPFVDVLSARNVRHLLGDAFTSFEKGPLLHACFEELLGDGIFNSDGAGWRQQRKVASHLFSFHKLNDYMFNVFAEEADKLVSVLSTYAQSGAEVDFQALMFDFTFDSICRIAFGIEMKQLGSKTPHPFCVAFDSAQTRITQRSISPGVLWRAMRTLQLGAERQFSRDIRLIDQFVYALVADRKKNAAEYADSGDLLSLFISDAAKRGEELSDQYLRNVTLNFLVAGRDTTATALTWMFYALDKNPECEARCAAEVASTLDARTQATPEQIKSLIETEAAFMESTRLWPPVASDFKQAVEASTFPDGTRVSKGTVVVYSPHNLNRMPEFYASSVGLKHWAADCEQYKPARWIVEDADTKGLKILQPSAYDFPTFNAGLRLCLGRSMAILEGKVVASAVLQNFKIRVRPGYTPQERTSIVFLMDAPGLPVTVHRRHK